jgi:excinuclease ABC subunit A
MEGDRIVVKGAREHNLKNISLEIPRRKLVVITGVSGSGKSSLAFDTIYAEGQRRYVESLSAYARQFLELMEKPDVDTIDGLSPAISIEQRTVSKNPRSTVATVTEIYDYLRLLFARVGRPTCYRCEREIVSQGVEQIADRVASLPPGSRIHILAPLVRGRKGEHLKIFEEVRRKGFVRVRVDGEVMDLAEEISLDKKKKHHIEVVVDRLVVQEKMGARLADSLESALDLGDGLVIVEELGRGDHLFSSRLSCPQCGLSYPEISPRTFSFNSPYGACGECGGLGTRMTFDPELVVPDGSLSIREGAVSPWERRNSPYYFQTLEAIARHGDFDLDTPFDDLSPRARKMLLYGSGREKIDFVLRRRNDRWSYRKSFEGVIPNLARRYRDSKSAVIREEIECYMNLSQCPACEGKRLKKESLAVKVKGLSIADCTGLGIREALRLFSRLGLTPKERTIARRVLKEIRERLQFLVNVGLDYLTLDREAGSLSGGEGQRIRLATQIGSQLVGVLYVLDEPSIGLHQRDNFRLLGTLKKLRDLGNTVLVVEHDEKTIMEADYVVDLGPGAGDQGGKVIAAGAPDTLMEHPDSLTGKYLSGRIEIPMPARRRKGKERIRLLGAKGNNLKEVDLELPIGVFTCITGVSGSGKSTLIIETLFKALAHYFYRAKDRPAAFRKIENIDLIDKVIDIDQSPIGRTPRSNPATYTGIFTPIRELFAAVPESRLRGYRAGRFSFNVRGGRCEACDGDGIIKIEMHFLPDVYVTCDVCKGKRYNRETLEVEYRGRNIHQVLDMTVRQALDFFRNHPPIRGRLQTLHDVGLEYIKLGQPATTLSGGEAQRVKLSRELGKRSTGRTLFILDEPTTGLHFADIRKLLEVLNRLTDAGNTIVVIEHNLDVIKSADWIVDLGPEGGDGGGRIVARGTPETVAGRKSSHTGRFLRPLLS